MRRVAIDSRSPAPAAIEEAAAAVLAGEVVAMPTDTLYGLAADPFSRQAVARVFAVKDRARERALPLVASDAGQVVDRLGVLPPLARRLADRFWPGPLTLLLPAPPALAPEVAGGTGRIGVRVPDHAVARALCRAAGRPLTATSANVSGAPPSADPDEVARAVGDRIALLLDAGRTRGGPPSTIVDATGARPVLIRAGAISWDEVQACVAGA
ncbi:MAG: L-threonylcarbamoyladenylate synthase [Betaproteobacteria bacterium]